MKPTAKTKKTYPILSLRISVKQDAYLTREADERGISVAKYVRAVLFPFHLSDDKIIVDKV